MSPSHSNADRQYVAPRELFSAAQIEHRVRELAKDISRDYRDLRPTLVCVLNGALPFFGDLARALTIDVRFDALRAQSYSGTESGGQVVLSADLSESVSGRHVLLVEDIVDTGLTARHLLEELQARGPASVKVVSLLDKPSRRRCEVGVDYVGFTVGDEFVAGYGMDLDGRFRNLPYIGVVDT